ncbi:L-asparaginase isoform X2 [Onthophagus taurus]|nr:L-asparaginase isoform X2 [Onthophagus taurus]
MVKNDDGVYIPASNRFIQKIKSYPELHNEQVLSKYIEGIPEEDYLIMPQIHNRNTILYTIKEYNPLLDSSNMSVDDWVRIVKDIESFYDYYDGFVILHGTDTLAYTASALSFMLEDLQKAVIVTGSQIPIFEVRSDAKDNFLSSLIFAGCYKIPEVCVCFANQLLRGNRTVKFSSCNLEAFNSPNYGPLGIVGINFEVYPNNIAKINNTKTLKVYTEMSKNVAMIQLFPTISADMLIAFLKPPTMGVIIESYGIGNIPSKRADLLDVLVQAIKRDVIVVNITQCCQGTVDSTYETGKILEQLGIIPGHDMTVEAALSKLSYVLGLSLSLTAKKQLMKTNLRGELTQH